MRGIGSIRTATRWLSSSRVVVVLLSAGCVLNTTRFYTARAADERISLDEMRERADIILPIECPRVVHGNNSVFATTGITLDVDSTGAVQRAEIERGSGDTALDDVFGALAARLQLPAPGSPSTPDSSAAHQDPPPPAAARAASPPGSAAQLEQRRLLVSYACAVDAGTISLHLQPSRG